MAVHLRPMGLVYTDSSLEMFVFNYLKLDCSMLVNYMYGHKQVHPFIPTQNVKLALKYMTVTVGSENIHYHHYHSHPFQCSINWMTEWQTVWQTGKYYLGGRRVISDLVKISSHPTFVFYSLSMFVGYDRILIWGFIKSQCILCRCKLKNALWSTVLTGY